LWLLILGDFRRRTDDPNTWPHFRPFIMSHDVGTKRDRSTAVIGGNSPLPPRLLGILRSEELPQGLYGSARANALAAVDRRYNHNALIVADLSYDPTYAEVLFETFGPRVIGLHIDSHGDGMNPERRLVGNSAILVYTVGRSYLLELLHAEMQANVVRIAKTETNQRAYEQLVGLEVEMRESCIVYKCSPGQHDDLGISWAMLAWAARHPQLVSWMHTGLEVRRPHPRRPKFDWRLACT
jgi:hypothetical protein